MNEQHTDNSGNTEDIERDAPDESALADAPVDADATMEDEVAVLQRDLVELDDKYKRALADYQNFARRARQEVHTAKQQQLMDVARSLLTVLDHFDHALNADAEKTSVQDLLSGVQIVYNELTKTLEGFGIRRIEVAQGDDFDPDKHEALMRQAVEGAEPNRIAQELQSGYTIGDTTLRPAKVAVTE